MIRTSLAVASLVVAFVAVSAARGQEHEPETLRRQLEQLRSPVPVEFDGVPLGKLEAYFSNIVGLPISFDWASLESFGIDRETPVRLTMPNLPGSTAIQLAIYSAIAGVGAPPPELTQLRIVPIPADGGFKVSASRAAEDDAELLRHNLALANERSERIHRIIAEYEALLQRGGEEERKAFLQKHDLVALNVELNKSQSEIALLTRRLAVLAPADP